MSRASYLADIKNNYLNADDHVAYAWEYRYYAFEHWESNQDHAAIEDLLTAVYQLIFSNLDLIDNYSPYANGGAVYHFLNKYTWPYVQPAVVDMDSILVAMFDVSPHQIMLFEAYTQAYKASIWNAPFDEEYHAALVRKWRLWE